MARRLAKLRAAVEVRPSSRVPCPVQHAQQAGANAILAMRYDANEIMEGITEVLAYGTAVVVEPQ